MRLVGLCHVGLLYITSHNTHITSLGKVVKKVVNVILSHYRFHCFSV